MEKFDAHTVKAAVREKYARVAVRNESCCGSGSGCCREQAAAVSRGIGYSEEELQSVPEGANLGLGCGNPLAIATLKAGDTVLDLGSGAGFDCFIAAGKVGNSGKVIGVDMTPEMIAAARRNAQSSGYANVEFRLGELENLPVASASVDAVISNCVINLVPDKNRVFAEAFRVLKAGGRLMVSDIVLLESLPEPVRNSLAAYAECLSGAVPKNDYLRMVREAGFEEIKIAGEKQFSLDYIVSDSKAEAVADNLQLSRQEAADLTGKVVSLSLVALKP